MGSLLAQTGLVENVNVFKLTVDADHRPAPIAIMDVLTNQGLTGVRKMLQYAISAPKTPDSSDISISIHEAQLNEASVTWAESSWGESKPWGFAIKELPEMFKGLMMAYTRDSSQNISQVPGGYSMKMLKLPSLSDVHMPKADWVGKLNAGFIEYEIPE